MLGGILICLPPQGMITTSRHFVIRESANGLGWFQLVVGRSEHERAGITIQACLLEIVETHMRDPHDNLRRRTRYDEIAIVVGHSPIEGIPLTDRQQCDIGKTHGDAVCIKHLPNVAHRVALGTFHKDVGVELGDSHGIKATHLLDSLEDG